MHITVSLVVHSEPIPKKAVQKLGSKEGFPFLSLGVFIFFSPCSTVTKHAEKLKVHFLPH